MTQISQTQGPGSVQRSQLEGMRRMSQDCLVEERRVEPKHVIVNPVEVLGMAKPAMQEENLDVVLPLSLLDDNWYLPQIFQDASNDCSIPEDSIEDIYPCSPMQEGLLALSMKHPGSYTLQFWYQMPESLKLDKLEAAWRAVAKRAQVLRTRFFYHNSDLLQVVVNNPPAWEFSDENLAEFLTRGKIQRMNLGEALSRHTVLRHRDSSQNYLVWTVHCALVDKWSESKIINAVEQQYLGHCPAILTTPMFSCFIKHIKQQQQESARNYWREYLSDAPHPTFPPLPDPMYIPKLEQSNEDFCVPTGRRTIERRVKFSQGTSAPTATMIQAAWSLIVGMYSNVSDVVIGVVLDGRSAEIPGIERIPGSTVATVPLRVRFEPNQSVSEFLQTTQENYLEVLLFAHFGLRNIRRSSEHSFAACNFHSLLAVNSASRLQKSEVFLQRGYSLQVTGFAIVMECELCDGIIDFRASFDHEIFSEAQIWRMLQHIEDILIKMSVANFSTKVSDLQKASEADVAQVIHWNSLAGAPEPVRSCVRNVRPPSTKTESLIHDLWKSLLSTDHIGIDDNFFDLGGSSVLAMRLVSMARKKGMTMTVNGIFESTDLKHLASTVRENVRTADIPPFALLGDLDVIELRRETALQCKVGEEALEDIYPCSAMQQHYVTGYPEAKRNSAAPWEWTQQMVCSLPRSINLERFRAAWDSAIRRNPTLRTRLINSSSGIFQAVLKESEPLKWMESRNLTRYLDADRSDNMTFGDKLLRLCIVDCDSTGERLFVITIHHTIYDGFSQSMLFKELETDYFGGFTNTPRSKMNQFIKYIMEADKAAATDFWTSCLAGVITKPLLTPPAEYTVLHQIAKKMIMDVPKLHGLECTVPTMIEVASGLAIARTLKCADVIFYSDRSGRNLPVDGLQDLVGPTTLFLPVRIHVDTRQKVQFLLRDSQSFQKAMMPHEHLGWVELRQMSHLKPALQHSLNININPNGLESLGGELGLEVKSCHETFDDPFGINVNLCNGKMKWEMYYDERFITEERVDRLLKDVERVFLRLADASLQPELTVGELFEPLRNSIGNE